MDIIICGAGRVGFNLARYLSRYDNHITVIDNRPELIAHINERLEVKAFCGHACAPEVLRQAGADNADMVIAVTQSDEVNMVTCEVAHALFEVETKIARLRNRSFLDPRWSKLFSPQHLNIDFVISPEYEVAHGIARTLMIPGALEVVPLSQDRLQLVAVRCTKETPVVNTPISHFTSLFPALDITVVGLMRGEAQWIPEDSEIVREGDKLYYVVATPKLSSSLKAFGHEDDGNHRTLILGGGNIGLRLAQVLEEGDNTPQMTLIERNEERASEVAELLSRGIVLCGDALDKEVLLEADVASAQTVVAVTADDRVNGLAALLAKRLGAARALALINAGSFEPLVSSLGVDAVINPRKVTVSKILQYINRHKLRSIYSLGTLWGEVMEVEVAEASSLVGLRHDDLEASGALKLAAVVREDDVYLQTNTLTVQSGDRVLFMVSPQARSKVERFFPTRYA
jgi:trk system potassium uptake protein TrkA